MRERFDLLGVTIEAEGNAGAPLIRALSGIGRGGDPARRPDLLLSATLTETPRPVPEPAVFAHHPLRASRSGGSLRLGDRLAVFEIAPDGRRIEADVRPEGLEDGGRTIASLHLWAALAFALRHHGVYHLHAAALADGDHAILVAGQSGAGKTTVAMALLQAGLDWLGDDTAFLALRRGMPQVQGVQRPFHARPATLGAFPAAEALEGLPRAAGGRALDPEALWPGRSRRGPLPPGSLLFPEVGPLPVTVIERLSMEGAFERLLESSALVVVDGAARATDHLSLLGRLAGLPASRVLLGADLLRAPGEVAQRILDAAG